VSLIDPGPIESHFRAQLRLDRAKKDNIDMVNSSPSKVTEEAISTASVKKVRPSSQTLQPVRGEKLIHCLRNQNDT